MDGDLLDAFAAALPGLTTWSDVYELARALGRVVIDEESGCWLWVGARNSGGYGIARAGGRDQGAHRVLWTFLVGQIEHDLTLDHLCRTRPCVNPSHLEPVTLEVNTRRGWENDRDRPNRNREKATCPQGHLYNEANTYRDGKGGRKCRTCIRERQARRRMVEAENIRAIKRNSYRRARKKRGLETGLPPSERTNCPAGHEYTEENTYRTPKGHRQCLICKREAVRRYQQRRKETDAI